MTETTGASKREISGQQRSWLMQQLTDWESRQLISTEQFSRIIDLYESPQDLAERRLSTSLMTLMGLAALLIGLGVLLLIGYNWQAMPAYLKLTVIFGVTLATHSAALVVRFRQQALLLSEVLFFLGCLLYGAGIFLIAQIFHVNAHYPSGLWWWALGVLPFAICLRTPLTHLLLVALLGLWCGMELIRFGEFVGGFWGRSRAWPNGAFSLPLFALPGLIWSYRRGSVVTTGFYVALLTWWTALQPLVWHAEGEAIYFCGMVGGLLLLLAESHPQGSPFSAPYRLCGALLAAGVLLFMSFYEFNEEFVGGTWNRAGVVLALVVIALSIAAVLAGARVRVHQTSGAMNLTQALGATLLLQRVPLSLIAVMAAIMGAHAFWGDPLLPTIVANVAMLLLALWLMGVGLRDDRGRPFAGGVLYFLLWCVVRYIDLFGDFGGMLGAALMFFLCGATLFGVAWYWRQRRRKHD